MLLIEAQVDIKILSFYGNVTRQEKVSIEWQLAERQMNFKVLNSNSWFSHLRRIFLKYILTNPRQYLHNPISKYQWKKQISAKVQKYWTTNFLEQARLYSSLKYLSLIYTPGKCHPIVNTNTMYVREISRIPTKLKIVTGSYVLQVDRVKFRQNVERGICELCGEAEENLTHFLLICKCLEFVRKPIIKDLISFCSKEIARFSYKETKFDILQLIVDPFVYIGNFKEEEAHTVIQSIRSLSSIVAEKNVHICSMCIKTN
jgi:hypothetical protein